jgi:hypothetical protein
METRSSSELVDKEEGRCHSEVHDARCHVTIDSSTTSQLHPYSNFKSSSRTVTHVTNSLPPVSKTGSTCSM